MFNYLHQGPSPVTFSDLGKLAIVGCDKSVEQNGTQNKKTKQTKKFKIKNKTK